MSPTAIRLHSRMAHVHPLEQQPIRRRPLGQSSIGRCFVAAFEFPMNPLPDAMDIYAETMPGVQRRRDFRVSGL